MTETTTDHGTADRYNRHGCRCQLCTAAHAERVASQRLRRRLQGVPGEHGTISTYTNYGCRCDLCKDAMRSYRHDRAAS